MITKLGYGIEVSPTTSSVLYRSWQGFDNRVSELVCQHRTAFSSLFASAAPVCCSALTAFLLSPPTQILPHIIYLYPPPSPELWSESSRA